jgi:hypothetical protein
MDVLELIPVDVLEAQHTTQDKYKRNAQEQQGALRPNRHA